MKKLLLILMCVFFGKLLYAQGVTLLYKNNKGWSDPLSWLQINTPAGQTPVQRVPTELDDVVISYSLSGIANASFYDDTNTGLFIGSTNTTGYRCRSMHISNTGYSFEGQGYYESAPTIEISTANGGFLIIDSGSTVPKGHFKLTGGNPSVTDLTVVQSTVGTLWARVNYSGLTWDTGGRARLVGSTFKSNVIGSPYGGNIYADACTIEVADFKLGDNSTVTLINTLVRNNGYEGNMTFLIGRNAQFVSDKLAIEPFQGFNFTSSGSVLNGHLTTMSGYAGGGSNFLQQDPLHPLPNIINGDVRVAEVNTIGIMGDLKIGGNFSGYSDDFYNNPTPIMVNGQQAFVAPGVSNYRAGTAIDNCINDFCHYKLEFFGSSNSNIDWLGGFPVDSLIINKTGCAKVTCTQPLYVSGAAKIVQGQLELTPNDTIPYHFVCAGDLEVMPGGGIFLRKNNSGTTAAMAVQGNFYDHNPVADSACAGISNPYSGNVTLYKNSNNTGNTMIDIPVITNLHLSGRKGSGFILGRDMVVYDAITIDSGNLNLNDHTLTLKKKP